MTGNAYLLSQYALLICGYLCVTADADKTQHTVGKERLRSWSTCIHVGIGGLHSVGELSWCVIKGI